MPVSPVSFGKVYVVSGKMKSMKNLNYSLKSAIESNKIISKDMTETYKNYPSDGLFAKAAQRGEDVTVIVTGDDVKKIKNAEQGWTSWSDVVTNMDKYYDLRKENFYRVVRDIMGK